MRTYPTNMVLLQKGLSFLEKTTLLVGKCVASWHNVTMLGAAGILAIITLVVGSFYLLYGSILSYHWIRYSESWTIAAFSLGSYAVGGAYLLSLMIAATVML